MHMMKNKSILPIFLFIFYFTFINNIDAKVFQTSSVVYSDNQVRFTVLTDKVIRMEWNASGKFTDEASFVAVNRKLQVPEFTVKNNGAWISIITDKLVLKYKKRSGKFTDKNVIVISKKGTKSFEWKPGMKQIGNLKGTYRTLDGFEGDTYVHKEQKMTLEDGLLSTDGWTLIDDSKNFLFDNSDWPWVMPRTEKDVQDWYFMGYGHDYKSALKDFTLFAGKVPLPPRYAFGYWWSRYWSYNDKEIRSLVSNFHAYSIPLDVLVVDMDWHYTDSGFGGWTGWTWNKRLFPSPEKFLGYLKNNDLKITLNLHPASGIAPYENQYPEMAKWMGVDSTKHETIPYVGSDKKFMKGLMDKVLRPIEKDGVDFWWLDWQQWISDKKVDNLSNTWWINYVFFSDMERNREARPMLYHRWGGLGNHRYQIGFSGDAIISWKSLAFQPYFTSCASNVLYGYWSHDIGGHMFKQGQKTELDPELYTRWMHYGAFTPILRTHSTKNAALNKEIWNFKGDYFEALRNVVLFRYKIAPYIYSMARETFDKGISLCRPMYYYYPETKEAYDFKSEYMFGDNMLIVPIDKPMVNNQSTVNVWLPEGNDWFEWNTGTLLKGGQTMNRSFSLLEYPVYVKAGSIIPLYDKVKNLNMNNEEITVAVFPGEKGSFNMYEDNGNSKNYATEYATTALSSESKNQDLVVKIGIRKGHYSDMPANRQFKVKVYGSAVPESVTVNGQKSSYEYIGDEFALLINVTELSCATEKIINIHYPKIIPDINKGMVSQFKLFSKTITALKSRDAGLVLTPDMGYTDQTSISLTYYPERFNELINQFKKNYIRLPEMLKEQKLKEEDINWFLNSANWKINDIR